MYQNLSDNELLELIFTEADRLGMEFVREVEKRRAAAVPFLSHVLITVPNYKFEDDRFWGVIHAVYLLGILGDPEALPALLAAGDLAEEYDIDWILEALPECYRRLGKPAIPALIKYIDGFKADRDFLELGYTIDGLWNLREDFQDERERIDSFFLSVLRDSATDPGVRGCLIGGFAQIGRSDLKPEFDDFFNRGEVDLTLISRENVDQLLEGDHGPPGFRQDLEKFYRADEIEARQRRWAEEERERSEPTLEEFLLENSDRLSRNEPCPCGSGKKFKKCHLAWVETERERLREEEHRRKDLDEAIGAVMLEREAETEIRRFLARKGLAFLFDELKARVLEAQKAPQKEFERRGFHGYFGPLISRIPFRDREETKEFMGFFMNYFNALTTQLAGHPRTDDKIN
ncbi:MAG: SEC-C domain-containing protein [Deltaproteobacteria bacterium]|nr:SEC-C domain-containing protein [Deltaproteobacteria bacterium]